MFTFTAKPYVVINTKTDRKYAMITSHNYPHLIIYQKFTKVNFFINDENVTQELNNTRYFILCGGCQIYTGLFNNFNLLPVNNVPFCLLKLHRLDFIFSLDKSDFKQSDNLVFEFKMSVESNIDLQNIKKIKWYEDENKNVERKLLFINGVAGTQSIPEFCTMPKYLTMKLKSNNNIKCIDQYQYDNDKIFFLSSTVPIYLHSKEETNVIYDKQDYEFTTTSSTFIDDESPYFVGADCIRGFELIHQLNSEEFKKTTPVITIRDVKLKCITCHHNLTKNQLIYYFDPYKYETCCKWINFINSGAKKNFKIEGLLTGNYVLKYDRIFCCILLRKYIIEFTKKVVNFDDYDTTYYVTQCDEY